VYELVSARIERQLHIQEKARCRCGETIITADPPAKVFDKTRFGPTFMAQVAVSKCADSIPLYLEIYRVERGALDSEILGGSEHLALRQARSKPVMEEFKAWLEAEQPRHLPSGADGRGDPVRAEPVGRAHALPERRPPARGQQRF
jgi:transposase